MGREDVSGADCVINTIFFILFPATLKSVGYCVIPSVHKFVFECPSVCLSVRPSVRPSMLRFHSLPGAFLTNFFKLGIRVDIGMDCLVVEDG